MFIKSALKILLLITVLLNSVSVQAINIITNSSVSLHSLSTSQLRRIYSMRQTLWPNDQVIVVYVLPSKNKTHREFSKKALHMFPYQLDRIWNKLTYSGVGSAPVVVNSQKELIEAVLHTRGAIGYSEYKINNNQLNIITIKNE